MNSYQPYEYDDHTGQTQGIQPQRQQPYRRHSWFLVGGDIDDFIFYDGDPLPEEDYNPHSRR